ncbi:hypothetical protein ACWFRF_25270 [Nocardia sp. NPDC055165]|uniref:hypothetical protein n=1 Tax=Nocardia sp. NPDC060220 TaxID=3347076 RepID=UPI0036605669
MSTAITTLTSPKGRPLTLIGDAKVSPNSVYPAPTTSFVELLRAEVNGAHRLTPRCLYVYGTDGWPYVVGVLRGAAGAIGDNSKPSFGRRMTRDVCDFIVAYSAL